MQYIDEACWSGYQQYGMKQKGGKQVPNCVPIKEAEGYCSACLIEYIKALLPFSISKSISLNLLLSVTYFIKDKRPSVALLPKSAIICHQMKYIFIFIKTKLKSPN